MGAYQNNAHGHGTGNNLLQELTKYHIQLALPEDHTWEEQDVDAFMTSLRTLKYTGNIQM